MLETSDVSNSDLVSVNDIVCPAKIERIEKISCLILQVLVSEKEKMLGKLSNFSSGKIEQRGLGWLQCLPIERDSYSNARKLVNGYPLI